MARGRGTGKGPRRWQVVAARVLAFVALLVMGAPLLYVFAALFVGWIGGLAGWAVEGLAGQVVTVVLTVLLFVPLAWLATRVALEGIGLGRRTVRVWAEAHGWATDSVPEMFDQRWGSPPFGGTSRSRVLDVVRRTDGRGTVHSLTYVVDEVPWHVVTTEGTLDGPAVRLTHRGLAERAAQAVGGRDITLEWHDFNERWRVESDEPRYAHAVLHQRMMERLVEPDTEGVDVLFEGSDVVVYAPGRTSLGRVEPMADLVLDLAALVPGFVVQDNPRPWFGMTDRAVGRLLGRWGNR